MPTETRVHDDEQVSYAASRASGGAACGYRGIRVGLRPRLLRRHLRGARLEPDQRGGRLRRASPTAIPTGASAWSTSSSRRATHTGLSKIYEMVINNDPCYAYLLRLQRRRRPEARDGARLRATAISSRTTSTSRTPTAR